jgi:CHAT domain-containing protein
VTGPSLCVSIGEEHLELAESEKALVKKTFAGQDCFEIDLQSEGVDFSQSPANSAKVLHMVTHSIPANVFTDPWFVSTSIDLSKKGLWLESVQREAHKLQFTLVVLNGCNTGTTSNRNYFSEFSTNEKIGLSSAFLLNRRCTVVATQWNEPEIVGYIFSSLFYKRLASQPKAAQAFILALVDLYELTKESAVGLVEKISDENARVKRCEAVRKSSIHFPFRDAYCLGMFQCHSLLVRQ